MRKESPFETEITVRGYELDSFNHVNHAVIVQYFEHTRWLAFRDLGFEQMLADGLSFVVRKLTVSYERPALLYDELRLQLWVERGGNTSITFGQQVVRKSDEAVLAHAEVVAVCLGPDGRPHPVPDAWKQAGEST